MVRPLAERLRADGVKVWFDEWVLKPGDSIPAKIEEGLTEDEASAGLPKVVALLAAGGEIAANAREDLCPDQGAEAAGDLLLHLDHADVLLALIVGKGDLGIDRTVSGLNSGGNRWMVSAGAQVPMVDLPRFLQE